MKTYKIVVAGPFNAGKTTLIRTLCGKILETDRRIYFGEGVVKDFTTVALDFGLFKLTEGILVRLFGTPGQKRFAFMWDILSVGMHGYIVMVYGADPSSFKEAKLIYDYFLDTFPYTPHILAVNKADLPGFVGVEEVKRLIKPHPSAPVIPIVSKDRESVLNLMRMMIRIVEETYTKRPGYPGVDVMGELENEYR